jgi:hypothetical protein
MKDANQDNQPDQKMPDPTVPPPRKRKRKTEPEVIIAPSQPGGPDVSVE